jgi:hypothetical protein
VRLDALAHELLIDYAERGLVDELPEPAPERVTTRHYGTGVVIGVAQDNDQDVLVKLDTTTSFGAQTVWQSRSELTVEDAALTTAQKLAQSLANITQRADARCRAGWPLSDPGRCRHRLLRRPGCYRRQLPAAVGRAGGVDERDSTHPRQSCAG